jgi:5'-3' exonuclease
LARQVCIKIDAYLKMMTPKRVFIAFDGIPPMAKMKQQRERRFKGRASQGWDTVQITPGTTFMLKLNAVLTSHFEQYHAKYDDFKLSTSAEPGEGEQKIFEWLRKLKSSEETYVYGLDSDLIILALHHLEICPIKMVREFNEDLKLLDIPLLSKEIEATLGTGKIFDYVFMTFFLGNDFLPHFPALNLRTNGLDFLLDTYAQSVPSSKWMYDGTSIDWKVVRGFLQQVAAKENQRWTREYGIRSKPVATVSKDESKDNSPLLYRQLELYINPSEQGWEHRYYTTLLKSEPTSTNLQQMCSCYFSMLAWNAAYYARGCPNWNVYYPYLYPPLLKDLVQHVPKTDPTFPTCEGPKPYGEFLTFVLPPRARKYAAQPLPFTPSEQVETYWAFCTYTWESHLWIIE